MPELDNFVLLIQISAEVSFLLFAWNDQQGESQKTRCKNARIPKIGRFAHNISLVDIHFALISSGSGQNPAVGITGINLIIRGFFFKNREGLYCTFLSYPPQEVTAIVAAGRGSCERGFNSGRGVAGKGPAKRG